MMKTGVALRNTTHQHKESLKGNYLSELWLVENPESDKSRALGFNPQPKGTLMCSYKIDDRDYWNTQVMTGNVKGFSLEGLFFQQVADKKNPHSITNQLKNKMMNKKQNNLWAKLTRFFLDVESVEKADATNSGTAYIVFILADGKEALVDADGFVTLDGKQLPAGEHLLADGNLLVVDADGQFVETKERVDKITNPEQVTAPQILSEETVAEPDENAESVGSLKAKIAELEARLAELAGLAKEANAEVQKLRKTTPSTLPATAGSSVHDFSSLKRYEQMACALRSAVKGKK
jgi:hypothetical protein